MFDNPSKDRIITLTVNNKKQYQVDVGATYEVVGFQPSLQKNRMVFSWAGLRRGVRFMVESVAPFGEPYLINVAGQRYSLRHRDLLQLKLKKIE